MLGLAILFIAGVNSLTKLSSHEQPAYYVTLRIYIVFGSKGILVKAVEVETLSQTAKARASWIIFSVVIATAMGQSVVFAVLLPVGREVGLIELQIGIIISSSAATFAYFTQKWGRFSDRVGRRPIILTGLLGYTAGTLMFASVFWLGLEGHVSGLALFAALIVARIAQACVMSATPPACNAYVCDMTTPEERTRILGKMGAAHSTGTILGPGIASLGFLGLLVPLYAGALFTIIGALLVFYALPNPRQPAVGVASATKVRYRDPRIWPFMLIAVSIFTCYAMVQQTLAYYIQDVLALDAVATMQQTGLVMMASAIAALASQWLFVQKMRWLSSRLIPAGLVALLLGFVLLIFTDHLFHFFMAMIVVGFGMGVVVPGFVSAASLAVGADEQGAVAGLTSAGPALGFILGPSLGSGLYQLQPVLPYIVVSVVLIPLLIYSKTVRYQRI